MGSEHEGVSPFTSKHLLDTVCEALRDKGAFEELFDDEMPKLVRTIVELQPSHYLADTYLEQSLVGGAVSGARALMVLDSTECFYLDHLTKGAWPARVGLTMPSLDDGPAWHACLVAEGAGVRAFSCADEPLEAARLAEAALATGARASFGAEGAAMRAHPSADESLHAARLAESALGTGAHAACGAEGAAMRAHPSADESLHAARLADSALATEGSPNDWLSTLLQGIAPLPLQAILHGDHHKGSLTVIPMRTDLRQRFSRAPYRTQLLELLRDCGCDEGRLDALERVSFAYGFPFSTPDGHHGQPVASVDLGYLTFQWNDGALTDVRAGILVTDRAVSLDALLLKPMIVYQWHITDNCDQRCKHCYLFAEDAQARCLSTPWDKLLHTLDEIEDVAARRHLVPMLAISGGDPILHPRFWDFAAELRRRGIRWSAMGNPFHLDEDVCRRLRRMGCFKYQLSLDGLEEFHDYLRKPGSWRATLDAIEPLRSADIEVQLMATASRQNLDDILACMDLAVEHEADSFAFARYCATSPQKAAELYPSPEEYRAFLLAYWHKKRAYEQAGCKTTFKTKDHLFRLLRWELGEFEIPALSLLYPDRVCGGCHLGGKSTIAANGDLLACRRMESVVGNVWTEHLYDVEEGPAMKAYAAVSDIKKCKDCELLMWCRGCRAVGVNATGDLQAADPMCWKA